MARRATTTEQATELFWLIGRAFNYSRQAMDGAARAHGLTVAQLHILYRIRQQPGLSGADVARLTFTSPQAAHVALATLATKGLIEREPGPDATRAVRSVLTQEGERVLASCSTTVRAVARDLAAHLSAGERQTLVDLLTLYVEPRID